MQRRLDQQKRITAITEFFHSPDRQHTFEQWSRALLDQMLVIDASCLWKRPDRKGRLHSLEIIDGSTIKLLLDDSGRRPVAPDPAYQQILHGVPAADFNSDELLYLMRNPRAHKVYGRSHVEQVILTVNTLIRRALHQLEFYRDGSQPDAFLGFPKEWTSDQIVSFQKHFDRYFAGNLAQRPRIKFVPGEFKYEATKPPQLKDDYDEWLARIICFVFGIAPTPFIRQLGHANVESQHDQAIEEGLVPTQKWFKSFMNRLIRTEFESPDLMFDYIDDREQDPKTASDIRVNETKAGIISIDEAREQRGEDSRFILSRLNRPSLFQTVYNDTYDGEGQRAQTLRNYPVLSVCSLSVCGQPILASPGYPQCGYLLDSWDGYPPGSPQQISLQGYCFPARGPQAIKVNYTAGFAVQNEPQSVPPTTFQVTVNAPNGSWAVDQGVTYASGIPLSAIQSGTPGTGQYIAPTATNGFYQFASGDVITAVLISYSYIPADIEQACCEMLAERYNYKGRIGVVSKSLGGQETMSFSQKDMSDFISSLLQPYKRVVLV